MRLHQFRMSTGRTRAGRRLVHCRVTRHSCVKSDGEATNARFELMGHLFVAQGDLTKLACDAVLVPCDADMNVNDVWSPILAEDLQQGARSNWLRLPGHPNSAGVVPLPDHDQRRIHAFVTVDDDRLTTPEDVVLRLWKAVEKVSSGLTAKDGRERPLIGVPLPGVGEGGLGGHRGKVIDHLLREHRNADIFPDVALILTSRRNLAAAQVRRTDADWPDLDPELRAEADRLGELARRNELSLFLGAGVSLPAGLPSWDKLLRDLAIAGGQPEPSIGSKAEDAATVLRDALGDRYHELLTGMLDAPRHAVGHALLANLRVPQMVTTNFDPCFELALEAVWGLEFRVLARELAGGSLPWLLKLNGDVKKPETIVLTREEFDRHKEEAQPLRAVVQSLMLTSHLLFVGYSMREESFLELAAAVNRIRDQAQCLDRRPVGTAIAITRRDSDDRDQDIQYLAMNTTSPKEGARQLEIFLDRVCWKAASSDERAAQYLLDADYESGLTRDEQALRKSLVEFMNGVGEDGKRSAGWPVVQRMLRALGADT